MKRILLFLVTIALFAGCSKVQKVENDPNDNGYSNLKNGEITYTFWAGQHIDVGTVTYKIDDNNFYIIYDCSSSGWLISETHAFAGYKEDMPLNKPGAPKVGKFPFKSTHNPKVSTYTYTIAKVDLPNATDDAIFVAAHAVVHNPNGGNETAWAEGTRFTDKGWGMYQEFYDPMTPGSNPDFTILYGTELANDSLKLYHLNLTTGENTLILSELVGGGNATYDGTAFDEASGNFFFTNYNTGELMINTLSGTSESFSSGTLSGTASSATFKEDSFYYVDENTNTIHVVTFTSDWQISSETTISTIPNSVAVTDIAIDPSRNTIYMVGNVDNGGTEMISYDIASDSYATISLSVGQNTQIAYSEDGNLYAVTSADENGDGFATYTLNTQTGVATLINATQTEIEDPISDISRGPIM
jgi:hypothetical protein